MVTNEESVANIEQDEAIDSIIEADKPSEGVGKTLSELIKGFDYVPVEIKSEETNAMKFKPNPLGQKKEKPFTVRLGDLREQLFKLANEYGMHPSELARQMIYHCIKDMAKDKDQSDG